MKINVQFFQLSHLTSPKKYVLVIFGSDQEMQKILLRELVMRLYSVQYTICHLFRLVINKVCI